jgi:ABC-type multidrug transport system fused ATPase/permease subunit
VNLGEWLIWLLYFFFMVIYFMMIFKIIMDVFRRDDIGGGMKALWLILLLFIPFLTMLIYVISQGKQMAQRDMKQYSELQSQQADYIRSVAGNDSTTQIKQAHDLLTAGAISQEEFDAIKAKALAS